jgi:hypothetical protein
MLNAQMLNPQLLNPRNPRSVTSMTQARGTVAMTRAALTTCETPASGTRAVRAAEVMALL